MLMLEYLLLITMLSHDDTLSVLPTSEAFLTDPNSSNESLSRRLHQTEDDRGLIEGDVHASTAMGQIATLCSTRFHSSMRMVPYFRRPI